MKQRAGEISDGVVEAADEPALTRVRWVRQAASCGIKNAYFLKHHHKRWYHAL